MNNCEVKLTCEDTAMNVENCDAAMDYCNDNFDPEVQIKHKQYSARFTCTCAPETTTITTTVVASTPYCETTQHHTQL